MNQVVLARREPAALTSAAGFAPDQVDRQILARTELTATGCRTFTGHLNHGGYGVVKLSGRTVLAHRAVWMAGNGPIAEGIEVCHSCDTPSCVEIRHLFLGTRRDNQQDMYLKGRGRKARGASHGRAKLSADDVTRMRSMHSEGVGYGPIAKQFGVAKSTAAAAITGEHWTEVGA